MNTHKIGRKLENFITEYLKEIDTKAKPTKGSGNSTQIADILNQHFFIEAKKRNTKNITIKKSVWDKLCGEIPIGSLKTPLYINQNESEDTLVTLELKDFIRLIIPYFN